MLARDEVLHVAAEAEWRSARCKVHIVRLDGAAPAQCTLGDDGPIEVTACGDEDPSARADRRVKQREKARVATPSAPLGLREDPALGPHVEARTRQGLEAVAGPTHVNRARWHVARGEGG